jgi:penicillin-insensitive murein endopeptidase
MASGSRIACGALALLGLVLLLGLRPARAQDTAAQERVHRAAVLAELPGDAAQRLFGLQTTAAPGPADAIGSYARGCLEGAVRMPADGPTWEVMRPSRNRAWGHPALIAFLEGLARRLPAAAGWPGLLIGDIAQPRGGPMLTGHASHQIGLDADIWLTPMPQRRLTAAERDTVAATLVVPRGSASVDPAVWSGRDRRLLETVARDRAVARIFVNPAIKRALCREAAADRGWLGKIRPWWGHASHFHVRISCPAGDRECRDQKSPPPGDGCGTQLDWWLEHGLRPPPPHRVRPILLSALPHDCAGLVARR